MKLQVKLHPVELALKETFRISRDAYQHRKGIVVELKAEGVSGYGEATEHQYYGVDANKMAQRLLNLTPKIENYNFQLPVSFWSFLEDDLIDMPFLHAAIDCAAYDLYGKLKGKPCREIWGIADKSVVRSSYTVSIDEVDNMVAKVKDTSFDIYKIKLGTDQDLEIVKALRAATHRPFRVDINGGWSVSQTLESIPKLIDLGVEMIEQPLTANDWVGMQKLVKEAQLPIFADESCVRETDVKRCEPYFNGIVIKLMKCGGITPALNMIAQARKANLKVMAGCMVESSVGISAICQLAPLFDYLDVDGALFLQKDIASGASLNEKGDIIYSDLPGLGIEWTGV